MYRGKVDSPCRVCKDRHAECHSDCKKYDFYKARVAFVKDKILECDTKRIDSLKQTLISKDNRRRYTANPHNKKNYVIGGAV